MNCERIRGLLPLNLTGDLDSAEASAVAQHLAGCPACRHEQAALQVVREALDAVPNPSADVDVSRIVWESASREQRALRHWRRLAFAGMALAACLVLYVVARPDIEIGNGQLVVRWGPKPQPVIEAPRPEPAPREFVVPQALLASNAELEERLKILSALVRALSDDISARDAARRQEGAVLLARLEAIRDREQRRWEENRRDLAALYTAQFGNRE